MEWKGKRMKLGLSKVCLEVVVGFYFGYMMVIVIIVILMDER